MTDKLVVGKIEQLTTAPSRPVRVEGVVGQGWIPCSERMPPPIDRNEEDGETYAVIKVNRFGLQFKDCARWQADTGWERWWFPDPRPGYTITHWMPLPDYPPNARLERLAGNKDEETPT